jgi:hypothetical protein
MLTSLTGVRNDSATNRALAFNWLPISLAVSITAPCLSTGEAYHDDGNRVERKFWGRTKVGSALPGEAGVKLIPTKRDVDVEIWRNILFTESIALFRS